MIGMWFWFTIFFTSSTLCLVSGGASKCPETCSTGSCCETSWDKFKCCDFLNSVCCPGGITCCPQGSRCTLDGLSCEYPTGNVVAKFLREPAQQPPALTQIMPNVEAGYVMCPDRASACSDDSTCCSLANQTWGCCPIPNAVCCGDGQHCCPQHTTCNPARGSCDPVKAKLPAPVNDLVAPFWPQLNSPRSSVSTLDLATPRMSYDGVHCSDTLECPLHTTCCRNATNSYGCCPMPDAVCCSDGEHCCPAGHKCDLATQRCLAQTPIQPKSDDIVCPDKSYHCSSTSTCCALPNQEWACCPFEKAVCCPDMLHCCPENTTCDATHGQCLKTVPSNVQPVDPVKSETSSSLCSTGLIECPGGTCCKNAFGLDACCPHPEAVCCNNGRCCPKGTVCDASTNGCLPSDSSSVPWLRKVPARQSVPFPEKSNDNLCPDQKVACPEEETCCHLIDGSFGCCPLANGTCCPDRRHCCPAGFACGADNSCVRELAPPPSKAPVRAERMISLPPDSRVSAPRWPELVQSKRQSYAQFCGLCEHDWLCCPDATGLANRKCCPAPGRICCPDGEHCCPSGTTCTAGGMCTPVDHHREFSSSVLLGPPKIADQDRAQFLAHHLIHPETWPALMAFRARINVLYLLPGYYRVYSGQQTVCEDRERYCELNQKCCPSTQHGYVCVPQDATCCYPALDTWCPAGSYCSDGRSCRTIPGQH